jgi:hypothetical protein
MNHAELRAVVIECLKNDRSREHSRASLQVDFLFSEVAEIAKARGLKTIGDTHNAWIGGGDRPELHPNLRAAVASVVWDLIGERVLRPGTAAGDTYTLPHIYVTEYGRKAIEVECTPYDPDGYLKRLAEKVPGIDPVIVTCLGESIETLRGNNLLSSTVMMGCASEQAMLLLFEKTLDACSAASRPALQAALNKHRTIKPQNEEYRKWFEANLRPRLKKDRSSDWVSEMENVLAFLFNHFRIMRNDAGHPTGQKISREEATANLVVFPRYLELIYDLFGWLDVNKPL